MRGRVNESTRSRAAALAPPAVLLGAGLGFLVWASSYGAEARLFPMLVAGVWVALCGLDLWACSGTSPGDAVARFFSSRMAVRRAMAAERRPPWAAVVAVLWVAGFVLSVIVAGFLPAMAAYVFLFVALQGKRSIRVAVTAAVLTTGLAWGVFEQLMNYEVYRGLLLENLF